MYYHVLYLMLDPIANEFNWLWITSSSTTWIWCFCVRPGSMVMSVTICTFRPQPMAMMSLTKYQNETAVDEGLQSSWSWLSPVSVSLVSPVSLSLLQTVTVTLTDNCMYPCENYKATEFYTPWGNQWCHHHRLPDLQACEYISPPPSIHSSRISAGFKWFSRGLCLV